VRHPFGLATVIAGSSYFLAAPLPTIFITILVISNLLSIAGIRGSTVNDDGSIELANTGPADTSETLVLSD
jgi:hypothetical protein